MMRASIRPTLASDLLQLVSEPLPFRIRALTAHVGDQVLGLGGLGYLPSGVVVAFVVISEQARKYPTVIHRTGLAAMQMIRASGERRVVALADLNIPSAGRWLERLGFEAVTVDGVTAYVWQA